MGIESEFDLNERRPQHSHCRAVFVFFPMPSSADCRPSVFQATTTLDNRSQASVMNGDANSRGPSPNMGYSGMSFDAETGNVLSSYTASQPPAFSATTGYFLQSGTLSAIGLSNNVIQWTFAGDGSLATAPILVNGYLFVGSSSGKLYALDASSGALLSQTTLGGAANGGNGYQLGQSGLSAGGGLLLVPAGSTLSAFTLSNNP